MEFMDRISKNTNKMKKQIIISLAAVALLAACTKDYPVSGEPQGQSYGVQVTALSPQTRTSLEHGENGISVKWNATDRIGIWTSVDGTIHDANICYNATQNGASSAFMPADKNTVAKWQDESSAHDFYAIYPYDAQAGEDLTSVPVSVPAVQVQSTSGSTAHLSKLDFLYAASKGLTMPEDKSVNFAFRHPLSIMALTLKADKGQCITDEVIVRFKDQNEVFSAEGAKIDITAANPTIDCSSAVTTNEIRVKLNSEMKFTTEILGQVYMLITPGHGGKRFEVAIVVDGQEQILAEKGIPAEGIPAGVTASIDLTAQGEEYTETVIDLSQLGTANCYVINKSEAEYKFRADVMGNGATTPDITPSTLAPTAARLFLSYAASGNYKGGTETGWADGDTGNSATSSKPAEGMSLIIDHTTVSLQKVNGVPYVFFNTPSNMSAGNAIIAVTDAENNIIWSWHIWAVPDWGLGQGDVVLSANEKCSGIVMMDRNLGALSCGPDDNTKYSAELNARAAAGLAYQYGRKDPFVLMPVGILDYNNSNGYMQDAAGNITKVRNNGSVYGVWSNNEIFQLSDITLDEAITEAIAHPERRYRNYKTAANGTNWGAPWCMLEADANASTAYKNLWGNPDKSNLKNAGVKTIYDPCPVGYRTPSRNCFSFFSSTGDFVTKYSANASPYLINFDKTRTPLTWNGTAISGYDFSSSYGFFFYTASALTSNEQTDDDRADKTTTYFPACGFIGYTQAAHGANQADHIMPIAGRSMVLQTNYPSTGYGQGVYFGNESNLFYWGYYDYSAFAAPVRCIKE